MSRIETVKSKRLSDDDMEKIYYRFDCCEHGDLTFAEYGDMSRQDVLDLLGEVKCLQAENASLRAERDALLKYVPPMCELCKYDGCKGNEEPCASCPDNNSSFVWRGTERGAGE